MRRLILSFVLALATACASTIPRPQIPSVPAPPIIEQGTQIAIFTVDVEPQSAAVRVGNREWVSPIGKVVEEFPAGETFAVTVRAPGYVPQTFDVSMTAGRMSPVKIVLAALPRPPNRAVATYPLLSASHYLSATDPDFDIPRFAKWLRSVGATSTRLWLMDAWALGERYPNGQFKEGQYDGFIPVVRLADGRFDLDQWDERYWQRLRYFTEQMNGEAVFPLFSLLELYSWSDRKALYDYVPAVAKQPYRFNVNGVMWGNPDDRTLGAEPYDRDPAQLPDPFLRRFACKVVTTLGDGLSDTTYEVQIGNEFPEKGLHDRVKVMLRECGYKGRIHVNRNEDSSGQYWNMGIDSGRFDIIEYHGKLTMAYLDEDHPNEVRANRPRTFREMWPLVDPARIIISSDGGGGNPDRLPDLREVACDALRRGASYEHQTALKRRRFGILAGADKTDRRLDMNDLAIDEPMLKSLASCRPQPVLPFILPIAA